MQVQDHGQLSGADNGFGKGGGRFRVTDKRFHTHAHNVFSFFMKFGGPPIAGGGGGSWPPVPPPWIRPWAIFRLQSNQK